MGLTARLPLPDAPIFQPFLTSLGVNWFNFATDSTDLKFQNSQYYLMPGIGWSTRLAKNLENGGRCFRRYEDYLFPSINVLSSTGSTEARTDNLLASVAARIAFSPSFNLSIEPGLTVTYRYALQPLTQFNGLTVGIGGTVTIGSARIRRAQSAIRSISFGEFSFPPLFAAMQSYYAKNPFAK